MEFRILGPLTVEVDNEVVDLGPRKQRSLLALLLINHGRVVSTDRILDELWHDDAEGKENALWVYVSRLRSALAEASNLDVLITRDHGYSLEIDPERLDAFRFERAARQGLELVRSDPEQAAGVLRGAIDEWRGNVLEDFTYDEFAQAEIGRLEELRRTAIDNRIEADLRRGRSGELIGELERIIDERPLDERPVGQLMLAMYRSGRQADALRCFERFRRGVGEELGLDPSPELQRLEEQILLHDSRLRSRERDESDGQLIHATRSTNPFRGLEAFREEDANVFFGRDRATAEILHRVLSHSIVSVVGSSGCGKSSVVRSGVLPAVRKGGIPGSDSWLIASMIPDGNPISELEAALLRTRIDAPDSLKDQLDGNPDELLRAVLRVSPAEDTTLLLVVDQFEELFTVCDPEIADRFLTAIVTAAADPRRRVRILLTLRSDFYDRPLNHPEFGSAMGQGVVNVVPMAPEELEEAASKPAAVSGVRLEPGLEATLIADVLGEPGALPLFEFTLTDLFDRRVGDSLTLGAYKEMGGIQGAVSRKADTAFDRLTPGQQVIARQLFLRLVAISDTDTRTRRRVEAAELLQLDLDVGDLHAVVDAFGRERLLSFDRNDVTGVPTVEVAHEALLEHWARLAAWIDEGREDVLRNARITAAATEWRDSGREPGYLLSGGRLAAYQEWAESGTLKLAEPEREYLEASIAARDAAIAIDEEREVREAAVRRRAKRNAWSLVALIAAIVLVGGYFTWDALQPVGPTVVLVHNDTDSGDIGRMVKTGFDRAAAELDIEAHDEVVLSEMESRLRELAESGTDLIIAGLDYSWFVSDIHADYPDTQFLIVDTSAMGSENMSAANFDDHSGSYATGVAAALTTESRKVGIVIGVQSFFMVPYAGGFEAGLASVDPEIDVLIDFVSSEYSDNPPHGFFPTGWFDTQAAYGAAWHMYEQGADIVFSAAGVAGEGVIRAASEFSDQDGRHVWAIGVDIDQAFTTDPTWSDHVLTSMVKRWDEAIYQSIEAFLDGSLAETTTFGFHNEGITLSRYGGHLDPILTDLADVESQLARGELTFPWGPRTNASWREVAADSARLVYDGTTLSRDRDPDVRAGDMLDLTIANRSGDWIDCGIAFIPAGRSIADVEQVLENAEDPSSAIAALESFATFSWSVEPGYEFDIRTYVPGEPFSLGHTACWPSRDEGSVAFSRIFPIGG